VIEMMPSLEPPYCAEGSPVITLTSSTLEGSTFAWGVTA